VKELERGGEIVRLRQGNRTRIVRRLSPDQARDLKYRLIVSSLRLWQYDIPEILEEYSDMGGWEKILPGFEELAPRLLRRRENDHVIILRMSWPAKSSILFSKAAQGSCQYLVCVKKLEGKEPGTLEGKESDTLIELESISSQLREIWGLPDDFLG
jgi:hypothetical protein